MRMLLTLIKVNLRVALSISVLKHRFTKERKKLWEPIAALIGAVLGIGCLLFLFTVVAVVSFYIFRKNEQPATTVLAVSFLASQFFLLFFGIFHILSSFYFSKDLDLLVPLPLKPYQVMGSKFVTIIINEYIMSIPMVLPAVVVYGVGMEEGILYWLKAIVSILLVPVIPLVISSLIVILLMRFVNIKKSKDIIVVATSFAAILIGLGINFFLQRMMNRSQLYFDDINQIQNWLIETIGTRFPPSLWVTYGLAKHGLEGWGYFLLFVLVSAALFALLLWIGDKVFYAGMLSGEEGSRKRKALAFNNVKDKYIKVSSPLAALFWKEWKLLLRTPVFMMNGLAGIIMMPVMAVLTILAQSEGALASFMKLSLDPRNEIYVALIGFGLMVLASSMNIVSSTAISREGQSFWISKMIPVSPRMHIISKLLHGMVISFIGILVIGVLMAVFIKFSVLKLLVLFVLSSMGSMIIIILDLIIDIFSPKLDWTNPHEAVKTNLNGLFGIIVSMGYMFIMTIFASVLVLLEMSQGVVFAGLFIFEFFMLLPCITILFKLAEKRYMEIEV